MRKYRVVDLFAGVGGLSYGFCHSGQFEIVAANEINPDIARAYEINHPGVHMINCDVGSLSEDILREAVGEPAVDVVVGGPPCQSYSTIGNRQMDARANLFKEYKRILTILKPRLFLFENVSGLLTMDGGKLFPKIRAEFENIGYLLKFKLLDAANYGVPQHRERVILVGMRGNNSFEYPEPTHGTGKLPWVTLGEAFADLPSLGNGCSSDQYVKKPDSDYLRFVRGGTGDVLTEHSAPNNGPGLIRIMQALKDGQDKFDLPEDIRPKKGFGNAYAKLWWDRPSTTVTRNFACPSSSRCIHPRDSRAMTVREGARLQSFPDNYVFYGPTGTKRLEIGNAVPPLLSIALAGQVAKALDGSTIPE